MSAHQQHSDPWARLRAVDAVPVDGGADADDTPWYLAVLIGVSAWIAAGFLFGFFATIFDLLNAPALSFAVGAGCCALACALLKVARGRDFIEQFAIATSLVGQLLVGIAFSEWFRHTLVFDSDQLTWLGVGSVALSMYAIGRLPMHRFLCGAIAAVAFVVVCAAIGYEVLYLAVPLMAWVVLGLWWRSSLHDRLAPVLPPMAWVMSLVLLFVVWLSDIQLHSYPDRIPDETMVLVRDGLIALSLPMCVSWLLRRSSANFTREHAFAVAIAAALALLWMRAPGVNIGVMLVLVSFALHRPVLLVVGALGVGTYLLRYYYQLDTTLLQKSTWLVGSGGALLAMRWAYLRFVRREVA